MSGRTAAPGSHPTWKFYQKMVVELRLPWGNMESTMDIPGY